MPTLVSGVAEFAITVAACAGLLLALGLPVRLVVARGRADPFGLETMVMGGGLFGIFAWWWSTIGGGGLRRGMPVLLLVVVVATVFALRRSTRALDLGLRRVATAGVRPVLLLVVTVALFGLHLPGFFTQEDVGPVSAGNNDLPFYALNAGHLSRGGFDDPSRVATWDLGSESRKDVSGAFLFVAGVEVATGIDAWRVTAAAMGFGVFLMLAALAHFIRRLGVGGRLTAVMLASTALLSGTFFYSIVHGYVAYALTLGPMVLVCALAMEAADGQAWVYRRVPVVLGALALTWVYVVYPHMGFFFAPFIGALVLARGLGTSATIRRWATTSTTSAVAVAAMFVLPVLVVPDRWVLSLKRMFVLDAAAAGWPLGRVRLSQWFGVAHFPDPPTGLVASVFGGPGVARRLVLVAAAALLLGAMAVVVLLLVRLMPPGPARADWLAVVVAVVVPLAIYEVLFRRYGELYQAWKAVTYLQPLVVVAVLVAGWHALACAVGAGRRAALGTAGLLVGILLAVVTVGAAKPRQNVLPLRLTDDHRDLAHAADEHDIESINVDLTEGMAVWDAMWAMYFMRDTVIHPVSETGGYMPEAFPFAPWTLRSPGSAVPAGATRYQVNSRFVLDREAT